MTGLRACPRTAILRDMEFNPTTEGDTVSKIQQDLENVNREIAQLEDKLTKLAGAPQRLNGRLERNNVQQRLNELYDRSSDLEYQLEQLASA